MPIFKTSIAYLCIIIFFTCCKKNNDATIIRQDIKHVLSPTVKQFNFRNNSIWILRNVISNKLDTITVFSSQAPVTDYLFGSPDSHETSEYFYTYLKQTLLPISWNFITYSGYEKGIEASEKFNSKEMGLGFFEKNAGDSVLYNNNTTWNKIEQIHSSIVINGHTYNNVYEMSYHPLWFGFSKIWWCPSIGFVKLEGTNTVTNQFESWELDNYNVQLY